MTTIKFDDFLNEELKNDDFKFGYLAEVHGNPYFAEDLKVNQFLINHLKSKLRALGAIKLIIHSNQMVV